MGRNTCRDKKLYFSKGGAMIALVTIWRTNPHAPAESLPRDLYECVSCGCFHITRGEGELSRAAARRAKELGEKGSSGG